MSTGGLPSHWGAHRKDARIHYYCDDFTRHPRRTYWRAIDIHAPAARVFRWLCQLKVAPYSYDWIDNLGFQSPRKLTPGAQRLAVGQRVMTIFKLIKFAPDEHLTLVLSLPGISYSRGKCALTYQVIPQGDNASRLVAKIHVCYPRGPIGWLADFCFSWADFIMMRKQFLNLKELAEG